MTNTNIPPQAYTKDDVTKAYLWIHNQHEDIKKLATSKESLVALYLQAKRGGQITADSLAPVSSKNFKRDLEALASELKQFDLKQTDTKTLDNGSQLASAPNLSNSVTKNATSPISQAPTKSTEEIVEQFKAAKTTSSEILPSPGILLDSRSAQIIRSVKEELNIESERDIIRMLLVLGYERIKQVFPKD